MKFLNRYTLFARYIPGLISILPLTLIYYFLTKKYNELDLHQYFKSLTFVFGCSATFILAFFISMIVRELGCFLESKYFNSRLDFPSNYLLRYNNDKLSKQIKKIYREKIKNDFGIKLFTEQQESNDFTEAVKLLSLASQMLSTKYQQNEQVKDANISYGFSRNVSGGLFIAIPASIVGIILGAILKENTLTLWMSISTVIYLTICLFHKKWIKSNSEKYATKIISIYVNNLS